VQAVDKVQADHLSTNDDPRSSLDAGARTQEDKTPSALDRLLLALTPAFPWARSVTAQSSVVVPPSSPQAGMSSLPNSKSLPVMSADQNIEATQAETIASGIGEETSQTEATSTASGTYEYAAAAASGLAALSFWTASARQSRTGGVAMFAPPAKKKPRIDAFDSLRFFLIAYIASGHFIHTATKNPIVLSLISQINVVVGAFFVLSGYVAAYTTTELGERKYNAARLDNPVQFAVTRIMGFWPLHMFVLLIFSPMFFWVDATYKGPLVAAWHGLLSSSLLSAWFPLSAEVWNAPTWFLSALAFCLTVLSYCLKVLALQSKAQLRRTLVILGGLSFIPRLAYSYDLNAWGIMEGMLSARTHPNYALFNSLRFSPLGALLEVLMGAAACRLVMLDKDEETEKTGSSILPLVGMVGVLVLRATGVIAINDMIVRSLIFLPLFIKFVMRLHRESVGSDGGNKLVPKILNLGIFKWLGGISFPIFIVHGPIGQLFYKKAVATKLFGGCMAAVPGFFGVYWATVVASA
jgi:peptidoglycan/LPS O-acetylase OafA/YrhL